MTTAPIPISERLHARLTSRLKEKGLRLKRTVVPEGWAPYEMMQELIWEDGAPMKVVKPPKQQP